MEPVSACNFRCPMCFQIDRSFTKTIYGCNGLGFVQKVVDEANEIGTGAITLASRGEPTMHPKLGQMLNMFPRKKIFLKLN